MTETGPQSTDSPKKVPDRGNAAGGDTLAGKRTAPASWIRSAGKLSLGTMASRLLGVARDITRAYLFGTGIAADAFTIAFRLPNMLRALFAEGALSAAFVPVLTEVIEKGEPGEWKRFVLNCAALLTLTLLLISLLGILILPKLIPIIVPGYSDTPGKIELTIKLSQLLFPYIFFIGLATLAMGTLNARRHFTAPAMSAAVLNVAMIGSMLLVCPRLGQLPETRVIGLAWGVLIGGALQLLIQIPPLLKHKLAVACRVSWRDQRIRRVGQLMLPGVVGMGVAEINTFVDMILGSLLVAGSVAALEYGNRVMQLPLGVFAVAVSTAILPTLSRFATRGEDKELSKTFNQALRITLFILIPITGVFLVVHRPLLTLLFERGAFAGGHSLDLTARAFVFYTVGICSYGSVKVIVPVFYSRQNTRTPVRTAATAMVANIILNIILMQWLQLGGLALATALASSLNVCLLLRELEKQYGITPGRDLFQTAARAGASTIASCAAAFAGLMLIAKLTSLTPVFTCLLQLATAFAMAGAVYLICMYLLGAPELKQLTGKFTQGKESD